mmetsp:Transcript_6652/g.19312  ORF Transcript_6652/g.19312 Transcript_6652/m.19312 type:complete len:81 (-) Transcript_6652:2156-2398(-)
MLENDLHTLAEGFLALRPVCAVRRVLDQKALIVRLSIPPIFGPMGREQPGQVWGMVWYGWVGNTTQHTDGVEASVGWRSG